ncbi:MAG: hypothetical protein RL689_2414 [Planctomycetota bacterium]|jgi:hypothetical protein
MKRTASPDGSPRRKKTFGGATVHRFSPQPDPAGPATLNVVLTFEEALKLQLSIGQLLGHLNGYDRATKEGRRTAVNLCIYTGMKRITVNEARLVDKPRKSNTQGKAGDGQASE